MTKVTSQWKDANKKKKLIKVYKMCFIVILRESPHKEDIENEL